ncbi:KEOPS complex subunit Pcc1 [uncultured Methanoregula sp.]|uniref:KEOPS complex subunit Pcc1 n=1 Tax=uncultured Methanoregula sp. TaxID=1005933 RepID=UPI002AAA7549|nr:KEOPS complex subunit Pcc1 [uncultured Methanoregula sp.]
MSQHEVTFRFTTPHAGRILRSLEPELADEVNPRSRIQCRLDGDNTLVLAVESDDTPSLRAALNMYLRLVNVADEMQQVGEGPGHREAGASRE